MDSLQLNPESIREHRPHELPLVRKQVDMQKVFREAMAKRVGVIFDKGKGPLDFFIASCAEAAENVYFLYKDMQDDKIRAEIRLLQKLRKDLRMSNRSCSRCLESLADEDRFCAACGQKNIPKNR